MGRRLTRPNGLDRSANWILDLFEFKFNLGRDSEARFGQDFEVKV